jgi:cell division septation protein DedD
VAAKNNVATDGYAVEAIGDISALPQSRSVQPANAQRDGSEYIQAATPAPGGDFDTQPGTAYGNDAGNVQYRVAASGELIAEDFTEVYIAENQIAEYERLNPAEDLTAPAAMQGEVTEVEFGDAPAATAVQFESIDNTPQPAAIEPPTAVASAVRAVDGGLPFYVQVATFQNPDNAVNMAEKLVSQQFMPVRLVPGDFGGKQLQQVRVGPYTSAQQANSQQVALVQAGYPRCFVIRSKN